MGANAIVGVRYMILESLNTANGIEVKPESIVSGTAVLIE